MNTEQMKAQFEDWRTAHLRGTRRIEVTPFEAWQAAMRQAVPEWISMKDQLPKHYDEVMVWPNPTDYCMTAQMHKDGRWTYGEYQQNFGHSDEQMSPPTHWMPLPAPPIAAAQKEGSAAPNAPGREG